MPNLLISSLFLPMWMCVCACKVWTRSIFLFRTYNCVCVCTNTSLGVCTDGVTLLREHNDINNILSLFQHHEAHRIKTHVQFACSTTELHAKQCIANRTIFRFPVFNCLNSFVCICDGIKTTMQKGNEIIFGCIPAAIWRNKKWEKKNGIESDILC